jgi:hypothetical protein
LCSLACLYFADKIQFHEPNLLRIPQRDAFLVMIDKTCKNKSSFLIPPSKKAHLIFVDFLSEIAILFAV